jgi:uncharacterized membrane protein
MGTIDSTGAESALSLHAKVVLFGLTNAILMTAGNFFQKLNGVRAGGLLLSGWVVVATLCYVPTFFIGNLVFLRGGRISLFIPMSAATYVFALVLGRLYFREVVTSSQVVGCFMILVGVALIARAP